MANKRRLTQLVEMLGATLTDNSTTRYVDLTAEAPKGFVFRGSGTHEITAWVPAGGGALRAARGLMTDALQAGLTKCLDKGCEVCHDED